MGYRCKTSIHAAGGLNHYTVAQFLEDPIGSESALFAMRSQNSVNILNSITFDLWIVRLVQKLEPHARNMQS
jgi:hypothetical protein